MSEIALNFLPLNTSNFSFNVFIRKSSPNEKRWDENIRLLKLPDNDNKYINFWVSFEQFEDSEEITINSNINIELTKWYLFTLLKNRLENENIEFEPSEKSFNHFRIHIITEKITGKGKKSVWMEPYYLKTKEEFGFLVDYKFIKDPNSDFDRYIQKLSLSLNDSYQSNKNFYIDKYRYIINFLEKDFSNFKELFQDLIIDTNFEKLTCKKLNTKNYIFKNNNISNSQFNGLMQYEVFQPAPNANQLMYIYLIKDETKQYANDLIRALNGEFPTFKGVDKLGLPTQTKNNTKALIIEDYNNFKDKLEEISSNKNFIIISIFPSKEEKFYYELKNYCLNKNIPLQTIHIETIADENRLKWSISGIALQMFTKLGGFPWLVKTENNNCLIVGIGQSIERTEENISRFFAYSVLLEASGKFLKIEPLADANKKDNFLKAVADNINRILDENVNYQRIIFHVPEKIKKETVKKIEEILKESQQNAELYILRINDDSRFFGYDLINNSMIPFESSYIQLSENEFLVWTEGLNYQNPKPLKRYGNPLYIQFFYSNQQNYAKELLLQDILNLSGANYRGFNAKALPVSLYYPKLISNFYKHFKEINLDQIRVKTDKLWFI
ncbi:MAG TPA: Piwi domain-containing protein [Bacteroidales bacterium]|nr:Piwi domain-containing protein [Bacteroidales bacterium]